MKFDDDIKKYISGEKFSRGLFVNISKKEKQIIRRFEFLSEKVKGKNVVHLGCCDHISLIKRKRLLI